MAIGAEKSRITVTMGNDLLDALDEYCKRTGISKSAYISYVVAASLDTSNQLISRVASIAEDTLADALGEDYGTRPAGL